LQIQPQKKKRIQIIFFFLVSRKTNISFRLKQFYHVLAVLEVEKIAKIDEGI
jgi:hypothetical protein